MNLVATTIGELFRLPRLLSCLLLAATALPCFALTPILFAPVHTQLTNDIAQLTALPTLSLAQRAQLRRLQQTKTILDDTTRRDGKTLLLLSDRLHHRSAYTNGLRIVASNLVAVFNNEYSFISGLVLELPTSTAAAAAERKFDRLSRTHRRLNNAVRIRRVASLYDPAKRRLDNLLSQATTALIIPFPDDMLRNSVEAKVNGVNFRTTSGLATENLFEAIVTSSNFIINVSAVDLPRGFLFSVPNAQPGSFRYGFSEAASFVNRAALYTDLETSTAATNGAIYVSTTATEVYGSFRCSGDGFEIEDGRFRITLSSAP